MKCENKVLKIDELCEKFNENVQEKQFIMIWQRNQIK